MNPTTTDLDSFEAALLQDLRDEVALRGSAPRSAPRESRADAPPTVASRSVRRRRSILAAAGARRGLEGREEPARRVRRTHRILSRPWTEPSNRRARTPTTEP